MTQPTPPSFSYHANGVGGSSRVAGEQLRWHWHYALAIGAVVVVSRGHTNVCTGTTCIDSVAKCTITGTGCVGTDGTCVGASARALASVAGALVDVASWRANKVAVVKRVMPRLGASTSLLQAPKDNNVCFRIRIRTAVDSLLPPRWR